MPRLRDRFTIFFRGAACRIERTVSPVDVPVCYIGDMRVDPEWITAAFRRNLTGNDPDDTEIVPVVASHANPLVPPSPLGHSAR